MKTKIKQKTKHGDLRVWWVPQVPSKPFTVPVADIYEAALLLSVLADYDKFQLDNRIKPDYCNAGGLSVFDDDDDTDGPDGSWIGWYSSDGEELDFYVQEHGLDGLRKLRSNSSLPVWEG